MHRIPLRLLAPLAGLVLAGCFAGDGGERPGGGAGAGGAADPAGPRAAPALTGRLADGGSYELPRQSVTPTVLLFFRGSYCPLCLARMRDMAAYAGAYADAGVHVVAVTLDAPEVAQRTSHDVDFRYPIVSVDPATFLRWGVWPPGQVQPRPGDFVVDGAGRIRYGRVGSDAADRPSDVTLLGVLDSLRAAGALAAR
jgi:peroxiredoxin